MPARKNATQVAQKNAKNVVQAVNNAANANIKAANAIIHSDITNGKKMAHNANQKKVLTKLETTAKKVVEKSVKLKAQNLKAKLVPAVKKAVIQANQGNHGPLRAFGRSLQSAGNTLGAAAAAPVKIVRKVMYVIRGRNMNNGTNNGRIFGPVINRGTNTLRHTGNTVYQTARTPFVFLGGGNSGARRVTRRRR